MTTQTLDNPQISTRATSEFPYEIAVMLPCHNEAATIAKVVKEFTQALPQAIIYVYDNASDDGTAEVARQAGATVRSVAQKGKGNVIRRMFADIEADIYIMADGDQTYEADASPVLIQKLIDEKLDMVVGTRTDDGANPETYRRGHRSGNVIFTRGVSALFGKTFSDILSGYRVFSRRFVKSFPALSSGFEIETELTVHSLELNLSVGEVETKYGSRPEGSSSKLNKYRDGGKILYRLILMLKESRPLLFFGVIAFTLALISIMLAVPLVHSYVTIHAIPRIPTAILTTGVMLLAFISLTCGIILDSVCRGRKERKYLNYLAMPWTTRKP